MEEEDREGNRDENRERVEDRAEVPRQQAEGGGVRGGLELREAPLEPGDSDKDQKTSFSEAPPPKINPWTKKLNPLHLNGHGSYARGTTW